MTAGVFGTCLRTLGHHARALGLRGIASFHHTGAEHIAKFFQLPRELLHFRAEIIAAALAGVAARGLLAGLRALTVLTHTGSD